MRRGAAAYLVLVTALVPTVFAFVRVQRNVVARETFRFAERSHTAVDAVQDGLDQYATALRGLAGAFEASASLDPAEWNRFIKSTGMATRYPGLRSLGYAPLVRREELAAFSAQIATLLGTNLPIQSTGTKPLLFPTLYLDQFGGATDRRLGWDAMADPQRAGTIERVLRQGLPVVSESVQFARDPEPMFGFICYLPVFDGGTNKGPVRGVIFSTFTPARLLRSLDKTQLDPALRAEVFRGPRAAGPLLAVTRREVPSPAAHSTTNTVRLFGEPFTIRISALPSFHDSTDKYLPLLALAGGLAISFLVFGIAWHQVNARAAAERLNRRLLASEEQLLKANCELERKISEQKETEDLLAREKEMLAVTLKSIGDGFITANTAGRIVLFNGVAEKLTGWTQAEAIGRPLREVFRTSSTPDRPDTDTELLQRAIVDGELFSRERGSILLAKDGRERQIAESVAPIVDRAGTIVGAVLVFRDITDKLKTEAELLRANKLESIGVLAGGIAHDFNNILTVVLGNISLARMVTESMPPQLAHVLGEAEKASLRARDLTQRLLTFAKGGAPIKRAVQPAALLRECTRAALEGAQVKYQFFISDELWTVNADESQLAEVFKNLIQYAQHSAGENPAIDVHAGNHEIAGDPLLFLAPGRYVRISIRDHGAGLAPEQLSRIFDPYFTAKKVGSGLELATAYSIVRKHDGQIRVESISGEGTVFHVYLPAVTAETRVVREPQHALMPCTGARVLVMDDEPGIREFAAVLLQNMGCTPVVASDGAEAIAAYDNARRNGKPFDAVIMDLTVPHGMGGVEAIRQLRVLDPGVKAIVSSGYSNDPVMANFTEYGFCGVVPKPYNAADLHSAVVRAIATPPNADPIEVGLAT